MLKANEKKSDATKQIINSAIANVANGDNYSVVYGYENKNLLIITLVKSYAIGFNDDEFIVVPVDGDGGAGEALKFKKGDTCKFTLHGALLLSNGEKKVKLIVPGVVPSLPGTKQMPINQMDAYGELMRVVKAFG